MKKFVLTAALLTLSPRPLPVMRLWVRPISRNANPAMLSPTRTAPRL